MNFTVNDGAIKMLDLIDHSFNLSLMAWALIAILHKFVTSKVNK